MKNNKPGECGRDVPVPAREVDDDQFEGGDECAIEMAVKFDSRKSNKIKPLRPVSGVSTDFEGGEPPADATTNLLKE